MREQPELWISQKDRGRLKVLHEAEKSHLPQVQAGEQLKLRERWVRKLVARLRKEGDRGILRRLRGRASRRRIPEAVREKVVRLVNREYADFGPTLAAEYLVQCVSIPGAFDSRSFCCRFSLVFQELFSFLMGVGNFFLF